MQDAQVFGRLSVADLGDVTVTPGNARADGRRRSRSASSRSSGPATRTLCLGGDHTVVLGELRAHAAVHGPLGLVLLDAHADVWDVYVGERYYHGSPFRRAVEEGLLDPGRSLLAGMRGSLYGPEDVAMPTDLGFEVDPVRRARRTRSRRSTRRACGERVGEGPLFLSFDIDVLDPAFAPGTGTPEAGGLSTREALGFLRALRGLRFSGYDVVEVSPPYDGPGQPTAVAAANVAYELLTLDVARDKRSAVTRTLRVAGTLVLTALAVAYLIWKIDLGTTLDVLEETDPLRGSQPRWRSWCSRFRCWPLAGAGSSDAQGIDERLAWLTRAYFVAYTAGQVLPTSLGGDAVRIVETARRHGGRTAVATGTVVLERGLGGAATVLLGAVAFVLSIGRFDVSAYFWLEGVFVFGTIVLAFLFFARSARPLLRRVEPLLERVRLDRVAACVLRERPPLPRAAAPPARRASPSTLRRSGRPGPRDLGVRRRRSASSSRCSSTTSWARCSSSCMLVPFTLNGIAVREAFFVSFLGSLGVGAEQAFAAGFLFFLVTADHGVARRRDPALGRAARRRRAHGSSMVDVSGRRRHVRRAAMDRAVPRERASVVPTVVVDNGSSDGTVAFVRERFPEVRVIESENLGLAAGWNTGIRDDREPLRAPAERRRLARRRRASSRLVEFADTRPHAAFVGPRLSNPDGTLQRSVRGFPDALEARDRVLLPAQARPRQPRR